MRNKVLYLCMVGLVIEVGMLLLLRCFWSEGVLTYAFRALVHVPTALLCVVFHAALSLFLNDVHAYACVTVGDGPNAMGFEPIKITSDEDGHHPVGFWSRMLVIHPCSLSWTAYPVVTYLLDS
jgi:hypothetical protein